RWTISALSLRTSTTARREDTTHSGSKLAFSSSERATPATPPGSHPSEGTPDASGPRSAKVYSGVLRGPVNEVALAAPPERGDEVAGRGRALGPVRGVEPEADVVAVGHGDERGPAPPARR